MKGIISSKCWHNISLLKQRMKSEIRKFNSHWCDLVCFSQQKKKRKEKHNKMACSKLENNQKHLWGKLQFKTNLKRKDIILQNLPVEVSVGLTLCMDEPRFPCSCGFGSVRAGLAVVLIHWEGEASLKPVREVRPLQTPNPEIKTSDEAWTDV